MAINIDALNIAKYEHVVAVRRSDGMRLAATRHVVNMQTPIYWTISIWDKENYLIFQELPLGAEGNIPCRYRTSELLQKAAERGFVDWYHLPVAYIEAWPWNAQGVDSEEFLIPKYSPLDPTEYLVD